MFNQASADKQLSAGALHGLRVVDLSRVMAGPLCAQIMADLGADVIKVERPEHGDDSRSWGPPFIDDDLSAYFWSCNRGKRSVISDIASQQGQNFIRWLASEADVLIENFKVGSLEKYGLDYESLRQINPRLIYCSITGYGQTGPYRKRPGYDSVIQALGGLMSITGRPDEHPGGGPIKVGVAVTDITTATYSTIAILAAVNERHRSGLGQHIDMSLLDVQVASLANIGVNYLTSNEVPQRMGNRLPTVYPSDVFRCADAEDIMIIVGNDEQFRRFCVAIDMEGLEQDKRFSRNKDRVLHADALQEIVAQKIFNRKADEWGKEFELAQVPFSLINRISQVFNDPQVRARGLVVSLKTAAGKEAPTLANPIRMSRTPPIYERRPPTLGEHTAEVIKRLRDDVNKAIKDNT